MSAITEPQLTKLRDYLATHELSIGLGTPESACSIAAVNLTISDELTDAIPDCMIAVIGRAIITLQDAMPSEMRNSTRWKNAIVAACGTGHDREQERLAVIMSWMWCDVLPRLQSGADAGGFGAEWRRMCEEKTEAAARAAAEYWPAVDPCGLIERMIAA